MQLQGKLTLPSDREKVWDFVADPSKVVQCVPGLQTYTIGENRRITATVKVSIGFIRGTFQTNTRVVKEDRESYTAVLELSGSGAGSGFSALVNISIAAVDGQSELSWGANANVSGPLGSLAKPLIEGNIKKIVEQLFDCVRAKLS
jgi:hypothetical protein